MKVSNKRELQQISIIHYLDTDFKDFMEIYKKYTAEPYFFLVNDEISALSSEKIDEYEYLTGREILPSN